MVRFRREPAGRLGSSSGRCVMGMVACLLMGQFAGAQDLPASSETIATPNKVFDAPQTFKAPPPVYVPADAPQQQQDLLPANGTQEQGALRNVSFSHAVGDLGTMSVFGSPDPTSLGGGASFSLSPTSLLYVRDLQAGVYTNPGQTVVNAGTTFSVFSNDHMAVGGRALLGANLNKNLQDQMHFSGDAFGALCLPGETWLKGGFLYDTQNDFYKFGPTFGAVIMADARHPITVDFAYGMGRGQDRLNQAKTGILAVAKDDVQLRVGTYLSPMMQAGLSGNWARWDQPGFQNGSGIGGFTRISIADLDITVDVTNGNLGTRGFVNVAYVFGGPQRRDWRNRNTSGFADRPQDWLTRPVMRDSSLRVQQVLGRSLPSGGNGGNGGNGGSGGGSGNPPPGQTPVVGNLTQVLCAVQVNPSADQINPGVVDPGDGFALIVTLGNGSKATASNISVTNISTNATFLAFNSSPTEIISYPNLPGGGSSAAMLVPSAYVGVDPSTGQGASFNIDFDVISDGVTRRFRCPLTLGVSGNATPSSPAIALN